MLKWSNIWNNISFILYYYKLISIYRKYLFEIYKQMKLLIEIIC